LEVDYMGETCLRCRGHGHYARECPTPKGNGKGGGKNGKGYGKDGGHKGYGKDYAYNGYTVYGKDGGKDNIKGGKGGKGFFGLCSVCGEIGHRAMQCPNRKGTNMDIGAVDSVAGATVVGGVWEIASVQKIEEWQEAKEGSKFKGGRLLEGSSPRASRGSNRFEGLEGGECEGLKEEEWPKLGR
jgi:hypothetical protein